MAEGLACVSEGVALASIITRKLLGGAGVNIGKSRADPPLPLHQLVGIGRQHLHSARRGDT